MSTFFVVRSANIALKYFWRTVIFTFFFPIITIFPGCRILPCNLSPRNSAFLRLHFWFCSFWSPIPLILQETSDQTCSQWFLTQEKNLEFFFSWGWSYSSTIPTLFLSTFFSESLTWLSTQVWALQLVLLGMDFSLFSGIMKFTAFPIS